MVIISRVIPREGFLDPSSFFLSFCQIWNRWPSWVLIGHSVLTCSWNLSHYIFISMYICLSTLEIKRHFLWKKSYDQPRQHIKKQRHFFVNKCSSSQSYDFSSSHVWMWELDHKESWVPKNWCFWTVVLEKTLENPLVCKEIKPVNHKGNQSWIFIGRTHAKAETPMLWPPDAKNWLIWKDSDAGKDWRQEEKGMSKKEMVGLHHRLDRHEFEQAPGAGDGQGSLACCSPWGRKESDMSERLRWLTDHPPPRRWVLYHQNTEHYLIYIKLLEI